jgi:transcriptional regulator with XRE-family HTH domain
MTADKLRQAREAAGLTMAEAAKLAQVPYRTWQNWEADGQNHRRPPSLIFSWLELYERLRDR